MFERQRRIWRKKPQIRSDKFSRSLQSAEEERLECHVSRKVSEAPPVKVKEKFSPLKQRSPSAGRPHLSPEEIKDADRAAQKEKLHAELKKVLLQKGQRNLAEQLEPKMETTITEEKLRASEMVEVIVETEAQAGMTGFSISGGGKDGLFISDILKDSPASKSLPLLEGDQIISARVYFENIKYEDALKILQYAEQYKVGYCLKRTVPSSDVTVTPGTVEVKSPKAKMPKMTVKSLTPVKKKKKKMPSQVKDSEVSMEAVKGSELSAASMDIPTVDVEFSLPKFSKLLKTMSGAETSTDSKNAEISAKETTTEQKRPKLKFPRLRVKEAAAGGAPVDVPKMKAGSAKAGAEVEVKTKPLKVDVTVPKPQIGVSVPKAGTDTKEEKVFKTPQVELDIPLPTIKADLPEISGGVKVPGLSTSVKIPDVEIKMPSSDVAVEAPGAKLSMPQISKVGICTPQLQKEPDLALHIDGRQKTEIKLPSVEIAAPKLDVDLSLPKVEGSVEVETPEVTGQGFQIKLPKFSMSSKAPEPGLEVTPPQVKKDIKGKVSEDKFKMPSIKAPQFGISLPKGKLEGDSPDGQWRSDIKLPSLDVAAPKVDFDINVPKLESGDITVESVEVPDVKIKMPKISPPRAGMKVKDAYAGSFPHVDVKAEKIEAESSIEIPDMSLKMPKIDLPKIGLKSDTEEVQAEVVAGKREDKEIKLKGPKINLPSFGMGVSKDKSEMVGQEREYSKEMEKNLQFPSIKMPSVDISLPKVQDSEPGKLEVTAPTKKTDIKATELEGTAVGDLKFTMPKVSLPKIDLTAKLGTPEVSLPKIGDHTVKDGKIIVPELDISVPKIKPVEFGIASPKHDLSISMEKPKVSMKLPKVESDAIAFDGDTGDSKLGLSSIKMPSLEIDAPSLDINLNLPKVKTEASEPLLEEADMKFHMPKLNLPKMSDVTKNMNVELDVPKITGDVSVPHIAAEMKGPGLNIEDKDVMMSFPKVEIGVGKSTSIEARGGELKEKGDAILPKVKLEKLDVEDTEAKIKLPSVKLPSVAKTTPKLPNVDIDASLPKTTVELSSKEDLSGSEVKWKAPKFSLRKLGISGPKVKKGGEVDVKAMDVEGDAEIAVKGPKMKMPKFGIMFPKSKQDAEGGMDVKASKGKVDVSAGQLVTSSDGKVKLSSVKLPTVDISAPKLEVDIAVPKADTASTDKPHEINIDIPDVKLNIPKFSLPKFGKSKGSDEEIDMEKGKIEGKVSTSKLVKAVEASSGELGASSIEAKGKGKEIKMKMPAIKMPSFGISRKDADVSEGKLELSLPEAKTKKVKTAAQEAKVLLDTQESEGKTSFIKMPSFKMSPPKIKAPGVDVTVKGSKEDIQLPDVHVKVPQVALPSLGIKSDQTASITLSKPEAKTSVGVEISEAQRSDIIKMPSLEISAPTEASSLQISVPCIKTDISTNLPKAEVDVSDIDIKTYEGDLKIPKLSSLDVSVPDLELDFGLPKASVETSLEHETALSFEKNASCLKMPKVELPKFGESEAKMDIVGAKSKAIESEVKLKGSKLKMPHFDISLPKVKLGEEDIPFIEGEMKMHGSGAETSITEAMFSLPTVELPKVSTPKIRGPELELDVSLNKNDVKADYSQAPKAELSGPEGDQHDLKFKMPKIKMPTFGGPSTGIDKDTAKVDVKSSKIEEGSDSGIRGFRIKMPKLQVGSLKREGGEDMETEGDHKMTVKGDVKVSDHEESENGRSFKFKMPSFGISSKTTDITTEPLHPSEEDADLKFKMPKISLPDVGFSESEGDGPVTSLGSVQAKADDKTKTTKASSIENLEIDVGLKMPKIKVPTIGLLGRRGDDGMEVSLDDSEGQKSLFKMPDVEITTPKVKAHAEYEVEGAKLQHKLSKNVEGGDSTKGGKIKDEHKQQGMIEDDAERKYQVKLPKFAVSLPKAMSGDVELSAPKLKSEAKDSEINMKSLSSEHDTDHEGKKKKNIFSLGKVKDKSTGLLSSDVDTSLETEGPEVKVKIPKIKMKPSFGRSRGKGKGVEVNGEFEASARTEGTADRSLDDTAKSGKIWFPRLGFSSSKTNSGDINVNGTSSTGHLNGEKEISTQNGSQDGAGKDAKLKFPKVEFSSPYKGKEVDSEMNLKLVKTEEQETKEEANESSFSSKFKSPKITFSGFKKKEKGDDHTISSSARTGTATVEDVGEGDSKSGKGRISLGFLSSKSKGEYRVDNSGIQKEIEGNSNKDKVTKYKIPKLSLSTKTEGETTTETQKSIDESSQAGLQISLPQVVFTTHQEEQIIKEEENTLGFLKVTTTKQITTETVTEKTLAI